MKSKNIKRTHRFLLYTYEWKHFENLTENSKNRPNDFVKGEFRNNFLITMQLKEK